ncbi:valine--tRNA ligase [Rhabdaerophilum sp. SD176]|uniref:valine--tRNA ligase n=1 Tax=Rhabdaerophilum sp. SD176 TaxID=2983548 RepID=UPI0024DF651B|nr:valine--tRNA ligase [Rhabdaerophilum sp. SD176]
MEKTFDPKQIEARIARAWDQSDAFRAQAAGRANAEPFTIVIPPPNVTGSLHMGHALNNTLQDILCRYWRMKGRDVLWQPGTDHAGIATQMVVERKLASEGKPDRRTLGRESFLQEVWDWKAQSGGTIINQLKRLGASCDWSRERFTMDEGLSRAVLAFFVRLHEKGLLYKDKRLVNWDPKLLTAISDLEVEQKEVKGSYAWKRGETDKEGNPRGFDAAALGKILDREPGGHLYYLDYAIEGMAFDPADPATCITVATTRPETMLGDTAIAVHPENERLKHLIGRHAILPLVGRRIPIIADDYADPEKGTGAVKITPAHDFNDFDVGKRHGLAMVNLLDKEGRIDLSDPAFATGLSPEALALAERPRFEARKAIVAFLEAAGVLRQVEPHAQQVPHGDRSGVPIEPFLTEQWYVDVKPLAAKAMEWVRSGAITILPANKEADFFRWMENIEPWCVSRQLWWGHQIPAWYGPDGSYVVAESEADARRQAEAKWGTGVTLTRDPDVLDTWFSSALWPFSTLGWPDSTAELTKYYPTSVLVTGADILFFWVARMMMASAALEHEGKPLDVPFRTVYLHGLVRDEKGRKMSKSVGNVLDPLEVIEAMGADALRFTIASFAAQGRDPKLGLKTAEGYRNFCTKLWNASRLAEMYACRRAPGFDPAGATGALNIWAIGEADKALAGIVAGIEGYRFNEAALSAYKFTWNTFCDWYLELAKPVLQGEDGPLKAETQATTAFLLDRIVAMLHPFMPFITEELWQVFGEWAGQKPGLLCVEAWPEPVGRDSAAAEAEIGFVVDLITEIRSARAEMNVPVATLAPVVFVGLDDAAQERVGRATDVLKRLARVSEVQFAPAPPGQSVQLVVRGLVACLPLAGIIDFAAERKRLTTERDKLVKDVEGTMRKLTNPDFLARAPEEVVEENRERVAEAEARMAKIDEALARLG